MNSKPIERVYSYKNMTVRLRRNMYADNNSLAVLMEELVNDPPHGQYWEDYGIITVNLDVTYGGNYAFVDENNHSGIGKWLESVGVAKATGIVCGSGFVNYPLYDFRTDLIPIID